MKVIKVTMGDGSVWAVPVEVVAKNRAAYYADEYGGDAERSMKEGTKLLFDEYPDEVIDWAANNMNWRDVSAFATQLQVAPAPDFDDGWANGEKEVSEI